MMIVETTSKIKMFLVKDQEPKHEPKNGSSNTLTSKVGAKKELAALDKEAQELINHILDIVEDG